LRSVYKKLQNCFSGFNYNAYFEWNCGCCFCQTVKSLADARGAAQQKFIMGTMGAYYYIDLYKFTYIIKEKADDEALDLLALNLMEKIATMVFAEEHTGSQGNLDAKQFGLTINFPPNMQAYSSRYETYVQCFVTETTWLNLLMTYYKAA
jgi:hypothetical protein